MLCRYIAPIKVGHLNSLVKEGKSDSLVEGGYDPWNESEKSYIPDYDWHIVGLNTIFIGKYQEGIWLKRSKRK